MDLKEPNEQEDGIILGEGKNYSNTEPKILTLVSNKEI